MLRFWASGELSRLHKIQNELLCGDSVVFTNKTKQPTLNLNCATDQACSSVHVRVALHLDIRWISWEFTKAPTTSTAVPRESIAWWWNRDGANDPGHSVSTVFVSSFGCGVITWIHLANACPSTAATRSLKQLPLCWKTHTAVFKPMTSASNSGLRSKLKHRALTEKTSGPRQIAN